jgi:hypothetical protein
VREFIDVSGASGQVYRFRRVAGPAALPRMAGNFLFVRAGLDGPVVVGCGSSNDLTLAQALWPRAIETQFADAIYVRLDVARRPRSETHADIAERHGPELLAEEFDLTGNVRIAEPAQPEPQRAIAV